MGYTTVAKVEGYLGLDSGSAPAQTATWINWVQAYIDRYTKTTFEGTSSSKYYDGNGKSFIFIDDYTAISKIEFLDEDGDVEDTLDATDFYQYPLNETPKNEVRLNPYGHYIVFPVRLKSIKVTATFGVASIVPADIEWVATQMVGDIVRQSNESAKNIKSETLGEYSVTYDDIQTYATPKYTAILDLYREPTV